MGTSGLTCGYRYEILYYSLPGSISLSVKKCHLPPSQKVDILRSLVIIVSLALLLPFIDMSKICHSIHGQDTINRHRDQTSVISSRGWVFSTSCGCPYARRSRIVFDCPLIVHYTRDTSNWFRLRPWWFTGTSVSPLTTRLENISVS